MSEEIIELKSLLENIEEKNIGEIKFYLRKNFWKRNCIS